MSLFSKLTNHYRQFTSLERLVGITLVVSVLLPHVAALYIVNPLLLLYLAFKYPRSGQLSILQILMVLLIICSLVWNMFYGIPIDSKSMIRGVYIIELLIFFPYIGNVNFRNIYIYISLFQ